MQQKCPSGALGVLKSQLLLQTFVHQTLHCLVTMVDGAILRDHTSTCHSRRLRQSPSTRPELYQFYIESMSNSLIIPRIAQEEMLVAHNHYLHYSTLTLVLPLDLYETLIFHSFKKNLMIDFKYVKQL